MILTTEEAARRVGVAPEVIWTWTRRGHVEPVNPGMKPLRFREVDVIDCAAERMSRKRHAELDRLSTLLDSR